MSRLSVRRALRCADRPFYRSPLSVKGEAMRCYQAAAFQAPDWSSRAAGMQAVREAGSACYYVPELADGNGVLDDRDLRACGEGVGGAFLVTHWLSASVTRAHSRMGTNTARYSSP